MGARLRRLVSQLPYLPRALAIVWTAARGWTVAWAAVLVIQGALPVATVYLTRTIVNALTAAIRAGGTAEATRQLIFPAALMIAVLLAGEILRATASLLRKTQAELVEDHIRGLIQAKSGAVDLAFYETPEFYDHLHRARYEAGSRPILLVESLGSMLQNGITLAAMLAVLVPFGPWLPAALLVSTIPALYVILRYALLQHNWNLRATPDERRAWYFDDLLTSGESAAEVRLFDLQQHFQSAFRSFRGKLRRERRALSFAQGRAELVAGLGGMVVTGAAIGWMGWKAVRGLVTLGDLALFYQAFQQGLGLMRSLLDGVGQLYQNSLFLGNLFEFLSLEPKIIDAPAALAAPPLRKGIRFREVTFRYSGKSDPVLEHFNLEIPAGQMVTIVGPNGAGKSTLIKLLCRFYDPEEGSIEFDGLDLRSISTAALRRQMAVLFQQPVHYSASVAENIAMSDVRAAQDAARMQAAARNSGADEVVARLPHGYDTRLGSWFEKGTELSVGEWQRLGLARAIWREAPIILFDEPTSAMDPWAEARWVADFRQLLAGRTALMITHRFTTALFSDVIHVMTGGRIVESGSHQELLSRGGVYASGWESIAGGSDS